MYWQGKSHTLWAFPQKLPYPMLDDSGGHVGRLYEAKTTPDMRIIDAAGRIVYAGGIDADAIVKADKPVKYVVKALGELLAGQAVATPAARSYGCSVKYGPIMH